MRWERNSLIKCTLGKIRSLVQRDQTGGFYPVIEGPIKTIQMLEIAIKGIKALLDRALVCRFNGYWSKLVDLHSWLDVCWKPLLQ